MKHENQQRKQQRCSECERYSVGCEEECEFDPYMEGLKKTSRLATRKVMKAQKSNALKRAKVKLSSSTSKLNEMKKYEEGYHKMLHKVKKAKKEKNKAVQYRERRIKKNTE